MHRARVQPLGVAPKGPRRRQVVEALTAALLIFSLLVFDRGISVAGAAPTPGSLYGWVTTTTARSATAPPRITEVPR